MKANARGLVACELLVSGVRGFNKGEVAGFPPAVAEDLIEKKLAKEAPAKASGK